MSQVFKGTIFSKSYGMELGSHTLLVVAPTKATAESLFRSYAQHNKFPAVTRVEVTSEATLLQAHPDLRPRFNEFKKVWPAGVVYNMYRDSDKFSF